MTTEIVLKDESHGIHTTSLIIAEVFEKRHDNVLRDIENLEIDDDFRLLNFEEMFITKQLPNDGLRKDPYYNITRDGFTFLVMGYTGKKAAEFKVKFIRAFNYMYDLLNDRQSVMLRGYTYAMEELKLLQTNYEHQKVQLEEQAPIVEYAGKVLKSASHFSVQEIAKELGISAIKLNLFLAFHGIQFKQKRGGIWLLYEKYSKLGWTFQKTIPREQEDGTVRTFHHTYWTERGRLAIHTLWKNNPIPKINQKALTDDVSQLKLEV